jgi:hypothetical protein
MEGEIWDSGISDYDIWLLGVTTYSLANVNRRAQERVSSSETSVIIQQAKGRHISEAIIFIVTKFLPLRSLACSIIRIPIPINMAAKEHFELGMKTVEEYYGRYNFL